MDIQTFFDWIIRLLPVGAAAWATVQGLRLKGMGASVDALTKAMNELQDENGRLRKRIFELENKLKEAQRSLDAALAENVQLRRDITRCAQCQFVGLKMLQEQQERRRTTAAPDEQAKP